jgi:hypothetical protein
VPKSQKLRQFLAAADWYQTSQSAVRSSRTQKNVQELLKAETKLLQVALAFADEQR